MSEHVHVVTLRRGIEPERWCSTRRSEHLLVVPTLAGGFNAGDAIVRSVVPLGDVDGVQRAEGAELVPIEAGGRSPGGGVYRLALFNANRHVTDDRAAAFERDLVALAHHVRAIARWRLSRTAAGRWTHAWEQEFASRDGLTGPYMLHPAHWGLAERWFDPEFPEWLVDPYLCHAFCEVDGPAW